MPRQDTDGDGLTDCYEENDDNPWTDPTKFNGAQVSLSDLCHPDTGEQGLLYEDYDTREEIEDCLDNAENTETGVSQGGSSWPIPGGNVCSLDWGLGVAFTDCRPAGLLHVVGYVNVTQPHERCWNISDGSTAAGPNLAIAALLLDSAIRQAPITAADGLVCTQFPQGIHRIEWVYEFKERPTNGLQVGSCDSSFCDNGINIHDLVDDLIDKAMPLLPPCAEGECGVQCPCDTGGECESDSDCAEGVCGEDNGGHFGLDRRANVCWPPGCPESVYDAGCGSLSAPCGLCEPVPAACASDSDCSSGDVCGEDNGLDFGYSAADRRCWPERCPGGTSDGDTGLLSSPCGVGLCRPSCDGKQCGDFDGCGGFCPLCTPDDPIEGGCSSNQQCAPGFACAANGRCVDPACQGASYFELNCGEDGTCGPCLECASGCQDAECGVDPRCGGECGEGTCSSGLACVSGECVSAPDQVEPDPVAIVGRLEGSFSVSANGGVSYSIPIEVPPGRAGLQPELSVAYTGGKEDGILGIGWKLSGLPNIARCPVSKAQGSNGRPRPVELSAADRFCLGAHRDRR